MVVIDGFADMDTHTVTEACKKVSRVQFGLDPWEVLQAAYQFQGRYEFGGLLYDATMESTPDLLDSISVDSVIGNSSCTLRKCKNPEIFFSILDEHAIPYPEVCFQPPESSSKTWLIKHSMSTGGWGVSDLSKEFTEEEGVYFQRKIDGINFSLTFLANGSEIEPLGFNLLWVDTMKKDLPYRYAGAINCVDLTQRQRDTAIDYAKVLTRAFGLVGLNGMDCILFGDSIYVLEINPRIPATYELYETRHGNLLDEHIEVCRTHVLVPKRRNSLIRAHAIVYAPFPVQVPRDFMWPLWTADRPHPGERIETHQPICNVFAGGKNAVRTCEMIRTRKDMIINKLIHVKANNFNE